MTPEQKQQEIADYLQRTFNFSREQIAQMMPSFVETLLGHLDKVESAITAGDFSLLARAAHAMKGALLNLGMNDAAEIAVLLEENGKNPPQEGGFDLLLAQLKEKLAGVA